MRSNQYAAVAAFVFTIVAVLQFARAVYGWPVTIGSTEIPVTASWVAGAVAGLLAIAGFMMARRPG
jgi:hypothetical protein